MRVQFSPPAFVGAPFMGARFANSFWGTMKNFFFLLLFFISCKSNESITLTSQAKGLIDKGKIDQAMVLLDRAIKNDPKYIDAYLEMGRAYEGKNNFDEALKSYQKIQKINPKHVQVNMYLGNLYRRWGKLDQAISYVKKAVELSPGEAWMTQLLGNLYQQAGKIDLAVAAYEKAVKMDPNDHFFLMDLAKGYEAKGDNTKAIEQYKKLMVLLEGLPKHVDEYNMAKKKIQELKGGF